MVNFVSKVARVLALGVCLAASFSITQATCECVQTPCEIQQCPQDQAAGWASQAKTPDGFVNVGQEFNLGHGVKMKYHGTKEIEPFDGTLTKHEMTLDLTDIDSGGFVIVQRPEIWSRIDAQHPYTFESAGSWETTAEFTTNSYCGDDESQCSDTGQCTGNFCSEGMQCLGFCVTMFGNCMHPTGTDACSCSLVVPDSCTSPLLPPAIYGFNTWWNCMVSIAQEDHKICIVAIFAWDTE